MKMHIFLFCTLLLSVTMYSQHQKDTISLMREGYVGAAALPHPFNYQKSWYTRDFFSDDSPVGFFPWPYYPTDSVLYDIDTTLMKGYSFFGGYSWGVKQGLLLGIRVGFTQIQNQRINETWLHNEVTQRYDITQTVGPCQRYTYFTPMFMVAKEFQCLPHIALGAQVGLGPALMISSERMENQQNVAVRKLHLGPGYELVPIYMKLGYGKWWIKGMASFSSYGSLQLSTGFRL